MNNQDKMLLDDTYQIYSRMSGGFTGAPEYITENLKFELRPYQQEAVGRCITMTKTRRVINHVACNYYLTWQLAPARRC